MRDNTGCSGIISVSNSTVFAVFPKLAQCFNRQLWFGMLSILGMPVETLLGALFEQHTASVSSFPDWRWNGTVPSIWSTERTPGQRGVGPGRPPKTALGRCFGVAEYAGKGATEAATHGWLADLWAGLHRGVG
ncbi:hypothetical protein T4B_9730 [Trichinella pseudospiralis]|uniref:Uncharacterized protein n=2 Tax=Trichinella pseudospiralis TaxID=6337 RepID=A0A0V1JTF8_TRIPS|nr:hypothetical protein T4A_9804 [Trichinella pseudospiralis]KRY88806.1 hypothetical protein T4D_3072 [Trichinella pseudospiralis]KRZ29062.1 hypothetical protein T4B_9730 [Trichinella pseudospiralis]KRZ38251.1 hypothetical protein T4C_3989 [Trichinella pseudospiralis]